MALGVTCRLISPSTPHNIIYSPWLPSKTEQMLPTRSVSQCSSQRTSSSCHCFRPKFQPHPMPKSSSLQLGVVLGENRWCWRREV
nr:ferrochelatase-2, chloroplastic [Ipomoea trifida]